jgi:branched-chain amino acid transport system ATP-binding protein
MGRAGQALLESHGITKGFGGVQAINGLDLSLEEGELRCLIGPNGAGKSTFFSLLMGIHAPDSGRIIHRGHDITRMRPYLRVRRGLSLKFQTTRIYKNLTVDQNLNIPHHQARGDENGAVSWAAQELGLQGRREVFARELSHAEQQWLEIVMALATDPDLLLLDEPTAGMTPEETHRTAEFTKSLNERGPAILAVEHDMAFVREIGRQVTVLHQGSIFASGTVEEIEAHHDVQRIYLGEENHG